MHALSTPETYPREAGGIDVKACRTLLWIAFETPEQGWKRRDAMPTHGLAPTNAYVHWRPCTAGFLYGLSAAPLHDHLRSAPNDSPLEGHPKPDASTC